MRWFLVILLSISLLLSCSSRKTVSYTDEEKKAALTQLGYDMMIYAYTEMDFLPESLRPALPYSYTCYENYVPLYDEISASYLESLAEVLTPLYEEVFPLVSDLVRAISEDLEESVFADDSGLADALRERGYDVIAGFLGGLVAGKEEEMEKAYAHSEREFTLVQGSYKMLSRVGHQVHLALPSPASWAALSKIMTDFLLSSLAEAEKVLKNRPPAYRGSPYAVFWSYS